MSAATKVYKHVKDANEVDQHELSALAHLSMEEGPLGYADRKAVDRLTAIFLNGVVSGNNGLFVCEDEDGILGFIAGIYEPVSPCGPRVCELIWYVLPEFRSQKVGNVLIEMYEQWARSLGVKYVTTGRYANKYGETVHNFYNKLGYKEMEVSYIKELV